MENLTEWLEADADRRARHLAERLVASSTSIAATGNFAANWQAIVESPFRGGRQAAVERLQAIDPVAYGRSRNHVGGAVTRLSPWLRHGVLRILNGTPTAAIVVTARWRGGVMSRAATMN
ncbi:MAG: hypothetical protein EBZ13_12050 [Planctomycetia bacterium]|nr:hypothetical protein [Planctomycetia bacterium]